MELLERRTSDDSTGESLARSGLRSSVARLADKLILQPTRNPIDADHKTRKPIAFDGGHIEVWVEQHKPVESFGRPDLFVLKFPGTGGRAERGTLHPAEVWEDLYSEVWTVNPPGYGGSTGRATLRSLPHAARTVFENLRNIAGERPIVVTGNSLGNISALHVAANFSVAALLLRNPPPLRELITGKHGWWSLGLSRFIARQVPATLCSLTNAASAMCPALFIVSGRDRMVPPRYQQLVIDSHAGENRVFVLPDADHATPITKAEAPAYLEHLSWLRGRIPVENQSA